MPVGNGMLKKRINIAITVVAIAMAIYQMVSARVLLVDSLQHQNIHLGFVLILMFLFTIGEAKKRWQQLLWLAILLLSLVAVAYVQIIYNELIFRMGFPTDTDVIIGIILLAVVLIATSKAYGPVFSILCLLLIGYALFGHLIPGAWRTFQFTPKKLIFDVTSSLQEGLYGSFLGISANYLFLFILFGTLIQVTGAARFFEEFGKVLGRKLIGGAALSSVTTSALVGTITGSVAANIVTTGSFTIPLMKRVGYQPHQAAAIEATSSTGGMIMPPVMGAAAFVMASWTGIPYIKIAAMATIPAILYFFSAGLYAQLQAMKMKIPPTLERLDMREMLLNAPLFIIPLLIIIVLLMQYYSLAYVIFWALIAMVLLSLIRGKTRPSLKQWLASIISGAKMGAQIGVSMATIGVTASVMMHTGLINRLPAAIEAWSAGSLVIALILSALIAIILGMGLPTTAVYVLMALAVAPVLIRMGVTVEQSHLFAFYFGVIGMLTPPVAIAAVIAAKLAGTSYFKTAIEATKVGLAGFLVPFFMFLTPAIILLPQPPLWAAMGIVAIVVILLNCQIGICSQYFIPLNQHERWFPIATAIILFFSLVMKSYVLFAIGLIAFSGLTIWQLFLRKKRGAIKAESI